MLYEWQASLNPDGVFFPPVDYQTPLQTFDEEDLATAQLALLTPSAYSQEASDAAELELRNKLALRRRFAALKQLSQRVSVAI